MSIYNMVRLKRVKWLSSQNSYPKAFTLVNDLNTRHD